MIFLEHKTLYDAEADVPDDAYAIPFGEAEFVCDGDDVTIVAFSAMVPRCKAVAEKLARDGISVEVIDPRTTSPLDEASILESVERTGRLVVVSEDNPRCSIASDIAALVAEKGFYSLRAPVRSVTAPHTPVPFSPALEDLYVPSAARIEAAVRAVLSDPARGAVQQKA